MRVQLIKKTELNIAKWGGGTTTQLFIHPPGSSYDRRDFAFRISTATVEKERSVFTWLPGITRKLMVLEGTFLITHKDQHSQQLGKFDQDEFDGGWETSGEGKVTDFNLMLRGSAEGDITPLTLEAGSEYGINADNFAFIYINKGALKIKLGNEVLEAEEGDFLSLEQPGDFLLYSETGSEAVLVNIAK